MLPEQFPWFRVSKGRWQAVSAVCRFHVDVWVQGSAVNHLLSRLLEMTAVSYKFIHRLTREKSEIVDYCAALRFTAHNVQRLVWTASSCVWHTVFFSVCRWAVTSQDSISKSTSPTSASTSTPMCWRSASSQQTEEPHDDKKRGPLTHVDGSKPDRARNLKTLLK